MEFQLFGPREVAMFDFWSIEHFLWGIVMVPLIKRLPFRLTGRQILAFILAIAVGWEGFERLAELGYFGETVSMWKRGHEHWTNRFVSDIVLVLAGAVVQLRFPKAWRWAIVPYLAWGVVNYLAPTSMSVQEAILEFFL